MHSCRMHTGHSLTPMVESAPRGCLLLGVSALGVFASGGVSGPRGVWSRGCLLLGVSAPGGCLLPGGVSGPGGVCSQRRVYSQGGVCSWGVAALGGIWSWGVCFWGLSAPRGVCSGGVSAAPGGCGIPACTEADTPRGQNHRRL